MSDDANAAEDDVADRRLDLGLQELLGDDTPPDVRGEVVAQLAARARRGRPWLAAALVLLGLAVFWAVANTPSKSDDGNPDADADAARDAEHGETHEPIRIESAEELLALDKSTTRLFLFDISLSDLAGLSRFDKITSLRLDRAEGARIGDEELKVIGELVSLETLELVGVCNFTPRGRRHLEKLRALRVLHFPSKLYDRDLHILAKLPRLEELLGVDATYLTEDGLEALKAVRLKRLDLSRPFGHHAIRSLPKSLEWLSLEGLDLSAVELRRLQSLRELRLVGSGMDNSDLEGLVDHPLLRSLHIENCPRITAGCLATITSIESLTDLSLRDAGFLDDAGLARLARLAQLERLEIRGATEITDRGFEHLSRLSFLRELVFTDNARITDGGLRFLAELSAVRRLDLSNNSRITDAGLNALITLPLESLSVESCARVYGWDLDSMFKPGVELTLPNGATVGGRATEERR